MPFIIHACYGYGGMTANHKATLLTWIARQNDPFGQKGDPGPNLTLLFDRNSPYANLIDEVVLFFRDAKDGDGEERRKVEELVVEIHKTSPSISVVKRPWIGRDPTDHADILSFLQAELPRIRSERRGKRFVAHISPGTPSMQTIWVLMVETGMIDQPIELVKTYRAGDRQPGEPSAVKVEVGLDTFFKVYQRNQRLARPDAENMDWDPRKFASARLKAVYAEARRFAQVKVPLLILGERGTGKTTLASWIRSFGDYRKPANDAHPPVVPCGQYVEETMRAELFGYVKGAFTGANDNKEGLLAAADGDTLFLDEIGDISAGLQRLLIKALEEHVYSPLGSTKSIHSDFRLIAATNRPLTELREKLDPDFLDRIGLLRIEMPPLRELQEDLDWIWDGVLVRAETRAVRMLKSSERQFLRSAVLAAIRGHPLPGNLRDLYVVAYRAIAALGDIHEPMPREDAVAYALEGLAMPERTGDDSIAHRVAQGFLDHASLAGVLSEGKLATKDVLRDVQRYMASEIRQFARSNRTEIADICDMKERALRIWAKPDAE